MNRKVSTGVGSKDVISLTTELVAFNTVNPPGNEEGMARFIGELLASNGFDVEYVPFEKNRLHVIAEKGCSEKEPCLVFSGHLDTVPLGAKAWNADPFGGEIKNGRMYGRGTSDMKGGLAAMVIAAIRSFQEGNPKGGLRLIFTSGEELGCQGAVHLFSGYKVSGPVKGIIVGEPTANLPARGHKGALYLELKASGKTAHSSMPHLGENAIYKVARAITKVELFDFGAEADPLLGFPTMNVGKVTGGMNLNSVPDSASFTIDARTTTRVSHKLLLERLVHELGEEIEIQTLVDLPAVMTPDNDLFVKTVCKVCGISDDTPGVPGSLPYLTDASVLQSAFGGAAAVILGPGRPDMAHRTDEYCNTADLERAVEIYRDILLYRG